jgi:hypothetical protein
MNLVVRTYTDTSAYTAPTHLENRSTNTLEQIDDAVEVKLVTKTNDKEERRKLGVCKPTAFPFWRRVTVLTEGHSKSYSRVITCR